MEAIPKISFRWSPGIGAIDLRKSFQLQGDLGRRETFHVYSHAIVAISWWSLLQTSFQEPLVKKVKAETFLNFLTKVIVLQVPR